MSTFRRPKTIERRLERWRERYFSRRTYRTIFEVYRYCLTFADSCAMLSF